MFTLIHDVLLPREAQELIREGKGQLGTSKSPDDAGSFLARDIQKRILGRFSYRFKPTWKSPSYVRVESETEGHQPRYDGCKVTFRVLLSPPEDFKGGELVIMEPLAGVIPSHKQYLSAAVYTGHPDSPIGFEPVLNEVRPHKGSKHVYLGSFGGEWLGCPYLFL